MGAARCRASDERGLLRALTRDWQVSGLFTWQSGTPFTVLGASTTNAIFAQVARVRLSYAPGATLADAEGSGPGRRSARRYFNVAAFRDSGDAWGDTGRNILRGPSQRQVDLSLSRQLPLFDRQRIELRWDVFNALNEAVFANPGVDVRRQRSRQRRPHHLDDRRTADDAARSEVCLLSVVHAADRQLLDRRVLIAAAGLAVVCSARAVGRSAVARRHRSRRRHDAPDDHAGRCAERVRRPRLWHRVRRGSASELWVLTGRTRAGKAQLYRLDWLKNAVGGRWELDGAPALQGLAFDPVRGRRSSA